MRLRQTVNGRFVLREKLGEGSGGHLFEAFDTYEQNSVAVKYLGRRTFESDSYFDGFVQDLEHEASLLREFSGIRGIPDFVDEGKDADGTPFIVMKRIHGVTLRDYIERGNKPMEVETAVSLVAQLCEILGDLHDRGYAHRDVKPENTMIDSSGEVYLVDFGAVWKVGERPEFAAGTNRYAAPEQADDSLVAPSADVFPLGCMLVEMTTLKLPYPENYLMFVHQGAPPPEPALTLLAPNLVPVVSQMVAWDPGRRLQDGRAVFQGLRKFLPVEGAPPDCKILGPDPTMKYRKKSG